jgi:hypothetical protein
VVKGFSSETREGLVPRLTFDLAGVAVTAFRKKSRLPLEAIRRRRVLRRICRRHACRYNQTTAGG